MHQQQLRRTITVDEQQDQTNISDNHIGGSKAIVEASYQSNQHAISNNAFDTDHRPSLHYDQIASSVELNGQSPEANNGNGASSLSPNMAGTSQSEASSVKESTIIRNIGQQNTMRKSVLEASSITNHELTLTDINDIITENVQPLSAPNTDTDDMSLIESIGEAEWQRLGKILQNCLDYDGIQLLTRQALLDDANAESDKRQMTTMADETLAQGMLTNGSVCTMSVEFSVF